MIHVECKADRALVLFLTSLSGRQVIHENKGKYELCKRLSSDTDARGLIDEDPGRVQPTYLGRMSVSQDLEERGIRVLTDTARSNTIFVLRPRLEEWVLAAATESGLDPTEHGLPNRASTLHNIVNANLDKFDRLLSALKSAGSERLGTLSRLLS